MRIGFVSLYSWRPHVEHIYYLADLLKKAGHQTEFLTCDGDLPTCYTREIRDVRPGWQECLMCRAGGIRSFASSNVSYMGAFLTSPFKHCEHAADWAKSSASTLGRFESDEDYASNEFEMLVKRLTPSVELAYQASSNWIEEKKLDAIVIFNGRMDATRAIFEAGKHKGIPVASVERTWFGDGLQILPQENCLGLHATDRLVEEWSNKPLTASQAKIAAGYIALRFLRKNNNEWRAYNVNADIKPWPAEGARKILLIPGSRNEIWGHPDWFSGWAHPLDAYDALIDHFELDPQDMVLRCHPNWGEKIGKVDGHFAEDFYTDWAQRRGVHVISSTSNISTLGLIEQADAVVVASGSAALEAGALGKQIIGIAPANYQKAGIRDEACDITQLKSLKLRSALPANVAHEREVEVRRNTLRFCYTISRRTPQYVDFVKLETTTKYRYKNGGNANRLIALLTSGVIAPDDSIYADTDAEERDVLMQMKSKLWSDLVWVEDSLDGFNVLKRRLMFRWIDGVRGKLKHGDR